MKKPVELQANVLNDDVDDESSSASRTHDVVVARRPSKQPSRASQSTTADEYTFLPPADYASMMTIRDNSYAAAQPLPDYGSVKGDNQYAQVEILPE